MTHHLATFILLCFGWISLHQAAALAQETQPDTPVNSESADATATDESAQAEDSTQTEAPAEPVDKAAAETAALAELVRNYAKAYYLSDGEKLEAMSAGDLDATTLNPNFGPPTVEDRDWIDRNLASLRIEDVAAEGFDELPQATDKRHLLVVMDAGILPIDLIKADGNWQVDPRWWLGLHAQDDAQTYLAREFVRYAVGSNAGRIAQLALPHPELYALSLRSGHSASQLAILTDMTDQMPIVRLREGDVYNTPGQPAQVVTKDEVNDEKQLLLAYFNQNKLPIRLVKVDEKWKVDPSNWVELVTSNKSDENVEKLAEAKRSYDQRLATSRMTNAVGAGSIDQVKTLLKTDPPQYALDKGLAEAVEGYWVANQHGQMPEGAPWLAMIDQLLVAGADVNVNVHGIYTPLMVAVHFGNGSNIELVKLLLRHNADVNRTNTEGRTAFDLIDNLAYTQPLLNAGAKSGEAIRGDTDATDDNSTGTPAESKPSAKPATPGGT